MQKPLTERRIENIALFYLARFETSTGKLRQVLKRRVQRQRMQGIEVPGEARDWIENVLQKMHAQGYLNDERYAENSVRRWLEQGKSHQVIRQKLLAEGISKDMFEKYLTDQDDLASVQKVVQKKHLGQDREKDLAKLARAGFSYETARAALTQKDDDA